jgi:hypothetical protein
MGALKGVAASGKGLIGVLLPDTMTSTRYVAYDQPYLTKAFRTAGLRTSQFKMDNAQGSDVTIKAQADADIAGGATVLIVDPNTPGGGGAIEADAASKGVKVIDYDRLTLGGAKGRIYVSFDNEKVGGLIGQGEVDCATSAATATVRGSRPPLRSTTCCASPLSMQRSHEPPRAQRDRAAGAGRGAQGAPKQAAATNRAGRDGPRTGPNPKGQAQQALFSTLLVARRCHRLHARWRDELPPGSERSDRR